VSGDNRLPKGISLEGAEPGGSGSLSRLLLCGTSDFCSEARGEFLRRESDLSLLEAGSIPEAQSTLEESLPAVILAEDRALVDGTSLGERRQTLIDSLAFLAHHAPVVWIGAPEIGAEISRAVPSGVVDFVPRSPFCLTAAVTLAERHLRAVAPHLRRKDAHQDALAFSQLSFEGHDFGEVLRHELNNPLTGILGNAELLLLDTRRGKLELPPHSLQRLEVIAELAVRMRETVRQLSDRWMAAGGDLSAEKEQQADQMH